MRVYSTALVAALVACSDPPAPVADPLPYASPFMGTGGMTFAAGSAFPGACAPNGLAKVGPDTSGPYGEIIFLHYSGYWYGDDKVRGFSHLHLHGTGARDGGVLGVMPVVDFDINKTTANGYESLFAKESEEASPGYYALTLENGKIRTEITATTHGAHHRYTYGAAGSRWVVVDLTRMLGGQIESAEATLVPTEKRAFGKVHTSGAMSGGFGGYDVFFEIRTKDAWKTRRVWSKGPPVEGEHVDGLGGFALEFETDKPEMIVALSLVSAEGAQENLTAELPVFDFDGTRGRVSTAWRERLQKFTVYGGSEADRRGFYSAYHHAFLMPTVISDVKGAFRFGGRSGTAQGFRMLSDFSLWDSYRTLHTLYALVAPDLAVETVKSFGEMAKSLGGYPRWPLLTGETGTMLGAPADIVIADTYLRGVKGFDVKEAWDVMRSSALDDAPPRGRGSRDSFTGYFVRGWVASTEDGRSVSKTTEYAHADFALSQLATALGKKDDAKWLLERSRGYRKLFDPATGFLRARQPDGSLKPGEFDATLWDDYAEANARQSVWMAPHDIDGLAALFGGREKFVAALDNFFQQSIPETEWRRANPDEPKSLLYPDWYWPGNEPDVQAPFMFAQAGRPDLTQKWSTWARREFFSAEPEGIPGNDDGGTMASWYLFAMLGIYPLPGSDVWIVGSPLFPKVDIAVSGGVFTIEATDVSAENIYVQSATLNGEELNKAILHHGDLKAGGSLVLEMGPEASDWGRD